MSRQPVLMEGVVIEDADNADPDLNAAFFAFIDELDKGQNSGGTIKVYRVPVDARGYPMARSLGKTQLFSVPVGSMTLEDIGQRCIDEFMDEGQFKMFIQIMAYQDGKAGVRFNRIVGLERPRKSIIPHSSSNGDSLSVEKILDLIDKRAREQEQRTEQLLREVLAARQGPAINPLEQSLSMMEKLGAVAAVMAGRAPTPAAPANDMMQNFMTMMMTRMFEKMMDNPAFGGEGPKKDDSFASIISGIKEIAGPMMQASAKRTEMEATREKRLLLREKLAASEQAAPSASVPADTSKDEPVTTESETVSEGKIRLMNDLHQAMPVIIQAAQNGADPEQVCSMLMKAIPETDAEMNEALFELVMSPKWFEEICAMNAEATPHREWFEKLRDAIILTADPGEAPEASAP